MLAFTGIVVAMQLSSMLLGIWLAPIAFSQTPKLPYFDWGACPYEMCRYDQWTAHRAETVYDTWKPGHKVVAQIAPGERVTGISGVVITYVPGRIRMDRDYPEAGLHRGDILLTYTFRGEGFSGAWVKGKYDPSFDISFTKWPDGSGCGGAHCAATYLDLGKKVWWAEVKLKSGRSGWVDMGLEKSGEGLH
jgi:hypothetical protein